MTRLSVLCAALGVAASAFAVSAAHAGSFDAQGNFSFDPNALVIEGFENPDAGSQAIPGLELVGADDALEGDHIARVVQANHYDQQWAKVPLVLPPKPISLRARLWTRSENVLAMFVAEFAHQPSGQQIAGLFPTGRCTSDGWVEMESAPVSVDGIDLQHAWLELSGTGEIDAFELVPDGIYETDKTCSGAFDPTCRADQVCLAGVCRSGALFVPPLPGDSERELVVDYLRARVQYLFGGHLSRKLYLQAAIDKTETMRSARSAWTFWNGFATAVHRLHDWHTRSTGLIQQLGAAAHLDVCFVEADADLSHGSWASDPQFLDLVVAYTGANRTQGLKRGDRLVAVDGLHPIAWARGLVSADWGYWQADNEKVNGEFAERMRALIPLYARTFTVLHCDETSGTCSDKPEVIEVASLPPDQPSDGALIVCDNRPAYHFASPQDGPDPATHDIQWGAVYRGLVAESAPGENIYGMVFDYLWGPTQSPVYRANNTFFKQNARGLIYDHRTGNGGTIDAAEAITELVRDPFEMAIFPFFRPWAGFEGPETLNDGLAIFDKFKGFTSSPDLTFSVGRAGADKLMPVALLLQRDGSASDYLPYGVKGLPKVRLFGPHGTAGAFSTFFTLSFWGDLSAQFACGDTIGYDGEARIGHGVDPDEVVVLKQSDLIRGRDTIYERALQWVRSELKP